MQVVVWRWYGARAIEEAFMRVSGRWARKKAGETEGGSLGLIFRIFGSDPASKMMQGAAYACEICIMR